MPVYRFTRAIGDPRDGMGGDTTSYFYAKDDVDARHRADAIDKPFRDAGGIVIARRLERGHMVSVRVKRFRKVRDVSISFSLS